jgi:hypothetical protein
MLILGLPACIGTQAPANVIDGYTANARVFNDDPGSTLTITPGTIASNPATITIDDQFSGPFVGANRHDVIASGDGGATALVHDIDDSFRFVTTLTLTDGQNAPRKEAGIRMNSSIGDMLFIVNSDAGEIVAFGGPFFSFGNNAGGNGYTPGTSILMGIEYLGAGDGVGGTANTIEFFIDYGAGVQSSGPLAWTNLEGGLPNFQVGVYAQGGANAADDFINAVFTDTTYTFIPEPGTLTLLAMGLLGALARRRIGGRGRPPTVRMAR